jgi:hypothetical protein
MDLRTGQTYSTKEEALLAGVPESDIAQVSTDASGEPLVEVSKGPFKGRVYQRNDLGQLARIKNKRRR